jgi:hypothetical protein
MPHTEILGKRERECPPEFYDLYDKFGFRMPGGYFLFKTAPKGQYRDGYHYLLCRQPAYKPLVAAVQNQQIKIGVALQILERCIEGAMETEDMKEQFILDVFNK